MRYSLVAAALVAVARAQTLDDIPSCALPCIQDAVASETDCEDQDYACICQDENFSAIQGAATSCVIEACGSDVAVGEVLPATEALCEAQGGGDDSGSSSSSEAETSTSEPSEPTESTSSAAPTTPTAGSSTTQGTVTPTVTPTVTGGPTGGNGTTPAPTTSPVIPTGAAAAVGPAGGLAVLGLAVLAL